MNSVSSRRLLLIQLTVLLLGAICAIVLIDSIAMFYNFLIMPAIGIASYFTFKQKRIIVPLFILLVTYIWQVVTYSIADGFSGHVLISSIFFGLIYSSLVILGVLLAILFKFAFTKQMGTKKIVMRVMAAFLAFTVVGGLFFITNSIVGNPISAMLANHAIKQYVAETYPHLDLKVEKASYNFKDGSYTAMAKSKTSVDTKFSIRYRGGKVLGDYYDNVTGKFNTIQRLSEEYSQIAINIIAEELGYENNRTMVMFKHDKDISELLELDMKLDKNIPIEKEVTLRLDLKEHTIEGIATVLTDAHQAFLKHDCIFDEYGLYSENEGMLVMVHEVTPADIESGQLKLLLEEAMNEENPNGIRISIKERD